MNAKTRAKLIKEAGALAVGLASGVTAHSLVRQLTGEVDKDIAALNEEVGLLRTELVSVKETLDELAPLVNRG